jgi:hypothetical protein
LAPALLGCKAMNALKSLAVLLVVCSFGCGGKSPAVGTLHDTQSQNLWAGEDVILTLTAEGGTLEFACASGRMDEPLALSAAGSFAVDGIYAPEPGGPAEPGAQSPSLAARFSGTVSGDAMQLSVTLSNTTHGPYALTRGKQVQLDRCN